MSRLVSNELLGKHFLFFRIPDETASMQVVNVIRYRKDDEHCTPRGNRCLVRVPGDRVDLLCYLLKYPPIECHVLQGMLVLPITSGVVCLNSMFSKIDVYHPRTDFNRYNDIYSAFVM